MGKIMKKNIEIAIDINIARIMLGVAGFTNVSEMTDDEVFKTVLTLIDCYGATFIIK